jgi:hypothetical protein
MGLLLSAPAGAQKLKPEELVAKHLDSIGAPAARALAQARLVTGRVRMTFVVGGQGSLEGQMSLISEGRRYRFAMQLGDPQYPGEQFASDGEKFEIARTQVESRSGFGGFLNRQNQILREGLLGGALSTAWPLADLAGRDPKLSYDGMKKVENRALHQLTYAIRRKGGDTQIKLFFEPETFRHVLTVYSLELSPQLQPTETMTARQTVSRYRVEERFSNFQTFGGLTMPTRWNLRYILQAEAGVIMEYDIALREVRNNPVISPADFAIQPWTAGPPKP